MVLHTSVSDEDTHFTEKKKWTDLPKTMEFTGLPVLHYLEAAGLSRNSVYWPILDSITVSLGRQYPRKGKALSCRRILMLSKNNHSRLLFYSEPRRKLRFGN